LKLMIDIDRPILQINILGGQPNKLGNTKSGLEQDIDTFIVSGKMLIVLDKFQKCSLLFSCNRFSCYAVIDNYSSKLKIKWILAYQIIVNGHLKRRPHNTSDGMDGTVAPAILLQLNKPCSGIRYFDFVNPLLSKALFRDNV